jgi:glycosidase
MKFLLFLLSVFGLFCSASAKVTHPEWARDAAIYEVNVRQFTPSGTFKDFEMHLPRLKGLGVDILWFMPIHPIGAANRKGTLGSYYSVQDYLAVNPEFGTMEEFKVLVKKIHGMGMYVIIDWVANHSAWDNPLVTEHPDWYTKDSTGAMISPVPDWHDVADLNYDNPDLREWMIHAMEFWVREADIDGYRCDVAGMVPQEFWNGTRAALNKIKPVFMLAEDENPAHHQRAFDMTYSWELHHLMVKVAKGEQTAEELHKYFERDVHRYGEDDYRMLFTDNHDENSWNGTVYERFGSGVEAFAVLILTARGMPLVYSGQEAGLAKSLRFFDKDTITWNEHPYARVYQTLLQLKQAHPALWNGSAGGTMTRVQTSHDDVVFSFTREQGGDKVFVLINLSSDPQSITVRGSSAQGNYTDAFSGKPETISVKNELMLAPWEYRVLVK